MYWKKLLWIITLSCRVGSIRLHLDCLEELGDTRLSWRISATLISPFCSSSSFYAFLPLVVRPMITVRELFLNIILNSPEFNCSIIYSTYLISITKKMDQFLQSCIIKEWIFSRFNISPNSLPNRNCSCGRTGRFLSLWSCFGHWSAC